MYGDVLLLPQKRLLILYYCIDDHTYYYWVYLIKHCSELFEIYTTFQALFKTQHFAGIKCFRFDLNGQYNSNKFYELLVLDGTIHQTLCTDTLQQNDCNNPDLPHSFS